MIIFKYFSWTLRFCVNTARFLKYVWSYFNIIHESVSQPYSVQMRENTDQKNSAFGPFSRSEREGISSYHQIIKQQNKRNNL